MAYREFVDVDGRSWEAWEVRPGTIERRLNDDRRELPRFSDDRRRSEFQFRMHESVREGWLTFQCGDEKRRIMPIPEGWGTLPDSALRGLLLRATRVRTSGSGSAHSTQPAGEAIAPLPDQSDSVS
ncbi:MAG: hypothetical protein JWM41_440 [Gemmatimonadetes bacterium]|nr:hypothetical protein [Gemmatimonadota bacterium]